MFTEGQIDFEINSSLSFDVDISYSLPAKNGNDSISDDANINSNGVYNKNFNINEGILDVRLNQDFQAVIIDFENILNEN